MAANGVVLRKLEILDSLLSEIRLLGRVDEKMLSEDWLKRRAAERVLQVLGEVVIDICQRIISLAGQSPATSSAEAIERCVQIGALKAAQPYQKIAQFRNFVVHRYEKVEVSFLVDIINNRLTDFESFRSEILSYAKN